MANMFNELLKSALSIIVVTVTGYGLYKGVTALETKLEQRKLRKEAGDEAPAVAEAK